VFFTIATAATKAVTFLPTRRLTEGERTMQTETAVRARYAGAAQASEAALCCPVEYDKKYLAVIPPEVIEKDYGCGDPTRSVRPGETVLDLGSGTGKICFIAAQVVGPAGKVIGVDMTDEMLAVARRNAPLVAERIGYANVEFRKGRIQDLKPIVADETIDVVVSNCVLNLVEPAAKKQLFAEIHRVLKRGGRAAISDIVSDEDVPEELQRDPELWSGCISGALREGLFLKAFEDAGFYGITLLKRDALPWRTVQGIEFRSVTIEAFKGKQGACFERNQAVIYKGPFKEVLDDDGHRLRRGERVAVCDKTHQLYKKPPYREHFEFVNPVTEIPVEQAQLFDCSRKALRHPHETKGEAYKITTPAGTCCDGGNCD
jgi:arsenite methyltransferase